MVKFLRLSSFTRIISWYVPFTDPVSFHGSFYLQPFFFDLNSSINMMKKAAQHPCVNFRTHSTLMTQICVIIYTFPVEIETNAVSILDIPLLKMIQKLYQFWTTTSGKWYKSVNVRRCSSYRHGFQWFNSHKSGCRWKWTLLPGWFRCEIRYPDRHLIQPKSIHW